MRWLALLILPLLAWIAYERTEGFSPIWVASPLPNLQDEPLSLEAVSALAQPFHYLSRGRQCFVFESLDGKYVVKLFNKSYLNISGNTVKRHERRQFFKESYSLAWKELQQETGLLHVHQGLAVSPLPHIRLTNRIGSPLDFDLNTIAFVLQKKGEPFAHALPRIFAAEGLSGVEKTIDLWFTFTHLRIQKKIADRDADTIWNVGLCGDQLLHLDPGRLCFSETLNAEEEWAHAAHPFRKWLAKQYPAAVPHFDLKLKRVSTK